MFNKKAFDRDLDKDIAAELGSYFGRILRSLCSCGRSDDARVNYVLASKEAQELYDVIINRFRKLVY